MKLSYLVSTYNAGRFLNRHIEDIIRNQTDPDFEIIIVNPNSPDIDGLIAENWAKKDDRVKYIFHPEREPYGSSWLRAWEAAEGEFVVNSNTDDYHHPEFTRVFYDVMSQADDTIAFCYSGLSVVDENRNVIGGGFKPAFDRKRFSHECWAGPQVCWRNQEWFRNDLDWELMKVRALQHTSAYDFWLWLYLLSRGYDGYCIPAILTYYTQRSDSIENSNVKLNNYETFASIAEFFPEHFKPGGELEHVPEFLDFPNLPNKSDWIRLAQKGS